RRMLEPPSARRVSTSRSAYRSSSTAARDSSAPTSTMTAVSFRFFSAAAAGVRRPARRFAGGHAGLVADQQPRVVRADRARAHQDRVGPRPQLVHLVQVLGARQDQPVRRGVVQVAVEGDCAAYDRVRAGGHGAYATRVTAEYRRMPAARRGGLLCYMAGHAVSPTVPAWGSSRETYESVNPATGEVLATYGVDGQREVSLAVRRAQAAAAWWGGLSFAERRLRLLAWKSHLTRYMGRLAQLVHDETGKPLDDATLEIVNTILHLDWAARHAASVLRTRRVSSGIAMLNQAASVEYQPLGVVGVIGPWNYPVFTPMGSIGYALAAGNAVVFKPSEL